jgi:hypothetical protein
MKTSTGLPAPERRTSAWFARPGRDRAVASDADASNVEWQVVGFLIVMIWLKRCWKGIDIWDGIVGVIRDRRTFLKLG